MMASANVSASDESCPTTLLDAPGTPGAQVPLYTQHSPLGEDTALCWAAAAAQLVDFERARRGEPVSFHPTAPLPAAAYAAHTALTQGNSGHDSIRNGYEYMALQSLLQNGSCDQTLFGSSKRLFELSDSLTAYKQEYEALKNGKKTGEKLSPQRTDSCPENSIEAPPFLASLPSDILLRALNSDSWVGALSNSLQALCHGHTSPIPKSWNYQYLSRNRGTPPATMTQALRATLMTGSPVMAAIDIDINNPPGTKPTVSVNAGHVILVVGQRRNPATGKCEAVVRDSSVQVCRTEARGKCDEPHHWSVPFEELEQQLFAVTQITTAPEP